MSRDRPFGYQERPRARRAAFRAGSLFAALAASMILTGCDKRAGIPDSTDWAPLEDFGPLAVHVEALWETDVSDWVGSFGGVSVWSDGVIWIGERRSERIWEVAGDSRSVRLVRDDGESPEGPGGTLGMALSQEHGMYVLGRNGVILYAARGSAGTFSEQHRGGARGFAALPNGGYVVAYGQYPDDPHVDYALHRYDADGNHITSWHPAYRDEDWVRVTEFSGGPIAVTASGDLLLSELAPFRITRFPHGMGDSAVVLAEDETIVSTAEFRRAMPETGVIQFQWSHSVYIDEMPDGRILNVVEAYPGNRMDPEMYWLVVSPAGEVLGRTRFGGYHWVAARSGPRTYLVVRNGTIGEVRVDVAEGQ